MRSFWLLAATLAFVPLALTAYSDVPPPAHTGGFGEPTCGDCHDDNPVNADGGALRLEGVPQSYIPDGSYTIRILLRRAGCSGPGSSSPADSPQGRRPAGKPAPGASMRT